MVALNMIIYRILWVLLANDWTWGYLGNLWHNFLSCYSLIWRKFNFTFFWNMCFLVSLTVKWSHITEFWPVEYGQKECLTLQHMPNMPHVFFALSLFFLTKEQTQLAQGRVQAIVESTDGRNNLNKQGKQSPNLNPSFNDRPNGRWGRNKPMLH